MFSCRAFHLQSATLHAVAFVATLTKYVFPVDCETLAIQPAGMTSSLGGFGGGGGDDTTFGDGGGGEEMPAAGISFTLQTVCPVDEFT
jgi:hypothetical protein